MKIDNKNMPKNSIRPLTSEEMGIVSGGFWGIIGVLVIAVVSAVVETIIHKSDPDPLKGFGQNNDHND